MAKIKITLKKGMIGVRDNHIATVKALGLRKIGSSVIQEDTPAIRGMIHKVDYLVNVEDV